MYDRIAGWGFNMVRIPVSWANIEPVEGGPYNEAYLRGLDHIVDQFRKRHVAVIFSMHQWAWSPAVNAEKYHSGQFIHGNGWPVWLYDEKWHRVNPVTGRERAKILGNGKDGEMAAAKEFFANGRRIEGKKIQRKFMDVWVMLARRYKAMENVIGADMMNEPYGNRPGELEDLYSRTGKTIHRICPQWLLVFERSLSSPKFEFARMMRDDFPKNRAVYSFHLYPATWDEPGMNRQGEPRKLGKDVFTKQLKKAENWDVPLWLGEFHLVMRDHSVERSQSEAMLDFIKKNGMNWSYWAYQKDSQPLAGESGRGPVNHEILGELEKEMKRGQ